MQIGIPVHDYQGQLRSDDARKQRVEAEVEELFLGNVQRASTAYEPPPGKQSAAGEEQAVAG